jgi:predicted Ser/Thr protein kinase
LLQVGKGHTIAYNTGLELMTTMLLAAASAHEVVDGPVCLGVARWGNVLFSRKGRPWFLGFGDDAGQSLMIDASTGALGHCSYAPEVGMGAPPSPGGDLLAVVQLFRALTPLGDVPGSFKRAIAGIPAPGEEPIAEIIERINGAVFTDPKSRLQSAPALVEMYVEAAQLAGTDPTTGDIDKVFAGFVAMVPAADRGGWNSERYREVGPIGAGGQGKLSKAYDLLLAMPVVLKRIETVRADGKARQRALREARVARQIMHPHVVRGYDVVDTGGALLVVMEYLDGVNLDEWSAGHSPNDVRAHLAQVAAGLAALHHASIVHRDVKPSNVVVCDRGAVLVDLGLAVEEGVQRTTQMVGTLDYLAPEVAEGGRHVPASDVFAFARMATELLGPDDKTWKELISRALVADPAERPPISAFIGDESAPIEELVVHNGGEWFSYQGVVADLRRRGAASRILSVLASSHAGDKAFPAADLIAVGWPGEQLVANSGLRRVYVELHHLRKLGLAGLLESTSLGYRLRPEVPVNIAGNRLPPANAEP